MMQSAAQMKSLSVPWYNLAQLTFGNVFCSQLQEWNILNLLQLHLNLFLSPERWQGERVIQDIKRWKTNNFWEIKLK